MCKTYGADGGGVALLGGVPVAVDLVGPAGIKGLELDGEAAGGDGLGDLEHCKKVQSSEQPGLLKTDLSIFVSLQVFLSRRTTSTIFDDFNGRGETKN